MGRSKLLHLSFIFPIVMVYFYASIRDKDLLLHRSKHSIGRHVSQATGFTSSQDVAHLSTLSPGEIALGGVLVSIGCELLLLGSRYYGAVHII